MSTPDDEAIRVLAYHFWIERGRPTGSPEVDWERAKADLQQKALAKAVGEPAAAPAGTAEGSTAGIGSPPVQNREELAPSSSAPPQPRGGSRSRARRGERSSRQPI